MQRSTAHMPLLTATNGFRLGKTLEFSSTVFSILSPCPPILAKYIRKFFTVFYQKYIELISLL